MHTAFVFCDVSCALQPTIRPSDRLQTFADTTSDRRALRIGGVTLSGNLMRGPLATSGLSHSEHDPEKWVPVFGKDHAQTTNRSGMAIRTKVTALETLITERDMWRARRKAGRQ